MPDETPQQDRSASPGESAPGAGGGIPPGHVPPPSPPSDPPRSGGDDNDDAGDDNGDEHDAGSSTGGGESDTGGSGPAKRGTGKHRTGRPRIGRRAPAPRNGGTGDDERNGGGDGQDEAAPDDSHLPVTRAVATRTTDPDPAPDPAHDIEQRKIEAGVEERFPFGRPGLPLGKAHPFVFGFTAALGVITAWLLVRAATSAKSVIVMIVVALFLAVGLNPAVERLKRFGLSRGWAVGVVFLGVILFFAGFVASLIPPLAEQVADLTKSAPAYIEKLQNNKRIADWDRRYHLLEQLQHKISDAKFQETMAKRALDVGKQALSGTFQTLTILILTLYFLSSLPQIKTFFYQLAPRTRRARVALLGDEILQRIGGYVAGQFTIAFIAGVTSYIFLVILDVPYALALALIVAVTDLIPLVGATIGAVIVCLVAFLTSTTAGIVAVIFYVAYQQIENYLVYPRVMKRTVDVAPAVTIVAALIGGTLLGVVGALLAIPTAAAISLLIREVVLPRQETM
ncbi:AI-2E family transporter [Actinomadura hibisca]|uniref:AI-2E family transporter n=1 Tax=Actinomadura hibisca TaxID=68565 RepID=UPI00082AF0BF|nr:AI-2E family transporter [Actinomadura hibisca]